MTIVIMMMQIVDTIFPEDDVDIQLQEDMRQVLANIFGYMSISIEKVAKHTDLREDLKTNINNHH